MLGNNFKTLAETENMVVGYIFETAYIIEKQTNKEIEIDDFYGDPACALISSTEDWCLIGGEKLILWKQKEIIPINLSDIYEMRQIEKNLVEILTDPWSEKSGIWRIDVKTAKADFVREFNDYKNREYCEKINW